MNETYKVTEIGLIPESWGLTPIYELRNKADRYSFTGGPFGSDLKSEDYTDSGVRVIQLQNIGEGVFINKGFIYTSVQKADQLKSCNIYPDEIILAKMAPVGRCCKVPSFEERFLMSSDGIRLSVDGRRFDKEFIFQALNSKYFRKKAESLSTGTTRARIGLNELKTIELAIPPTKYEQKKIAEVLSTLDSKVEIIAQQVAETEKLKQGLMQQLLAKGIGHNQFKNTELGNIPENWEEASLGELIEKIVGGGTPFRENDLYWNGDIPWATVKDLKKSMLKDTQEHISLVGVQNSSANIIPAHTIIIATRMALGKAVFFERDVAINQDLKAIFPSSKLNKKFLFHWLSYKADFINSLGVGSTVKGITLDTLKSLKLALPPVSEQQKIAGVLDVVNQKLEHLLAKRSTYQELKTSLMQQLLTGKIRVNTYQQQSAVA